MRPAGRAAGRTVARAALALALVAAAALLLHPGLRGRAKALVRQARGYPAWRARAAQRAEEPFFGRLAASQVGYGTAARKLFTSPRPFSSFEVVREADGSTVLRGEGPGRLVETDVLGGQGRAWVGDFSALREPGRYRIAVAGGLASHPFDVGPRVYRAALRAVQRALYYQRAFTAIDVARAEGPWVHGSDAGQAPAGVVGGWHDAGDFSIYNASTTSALFWLLQAQADFGPGSDDTNIPESGNGVPDLLDEARWGLEWLLSVQAPSGGFRNSTCQERYGPYGTNLPERAAPYRAGEVGSIPTGRAVGTLAMAAAVFRPFDPSFTARALRAALDGQAWLEAHPAEASDGPTCPAFRQDGDLRAGRETRAWAAAGLLLATGQARFREVFEAQRLEIDNDPSYGRSNVYAALLYLRARAGDPARQQAIRAQLERRAAQARADGGRHPFGFAGHYFWGSLGSAFQRSGAFAARGCLADPERGRDDCEQVLDQVHYALGRNALQLCYLSGLPGASRSRSRAFHQWLAALRADPELFPGLVAGGPVEVPEPDDRSRPEARPLPVWGYWDDPALSRSADTPLDGRYTDNDSWSTNELDVEWQAVTLYALHLADWWAAGAPALPAPVLGWAPESSRP